MLPLLYPEANPVHPYPTGEDVSDRSAPPWRVWVPETPILVIGYSQHPERELNLDAVREDGIPVYRRKGGGGTVLLSPGCVCVALRLRRDPDWGIQNYFAAANGMIADCLRDDLGVWAVPRGISDLAVEERKVLGFSLYLPRESALYLACLMVDVSPALLDRYLAYPSREPEYRKGRAHADFIRNLSELPGLSRVDSGTLRKLLENRLSGGGQTSGLLDWPR